MTKNSDWRRVSRSHPCLICGKPDWCSFVGPANDPTAAICARIESNNRRGEAGWYHSIRKDPFWRPTAPTSFRIPARPQPSKSPIHFGRLAKQCSAEFSPERLENLAFDLGLSAVNLARLGVGWSRRHRAWTFPMRDVGGAVRGIRLRLLDGRKLSVKGGKEGLFLPAELSSAGRLLIAEGPTDTAALLDLGFSAVGRPSCQGGADLLTELVRQREAAEVVIVADADGAGRSGAEALAAVLLACVKTARVIFPPAEIKDARQWKQHGATFGEIEQTILATQPHKLKITVKGFDK